MKPDIHQILYGLIWSVDQLQKLIPDDRGWDFRAVAIVSHKQYAQQLLDDLGILRFPYNAQNLKTGERFVPTMIDYDNRQVWHQKSQTQM